MSSQMREISPVLVELEVEIPWETVQRDLDASFRKVGQRARVKGFRPGKVPHKVVRQIFGRQVRGEVTANLVEQGLIEALTEHELHIVARPHVHAPDLSDGKPLTFSAKIEIRPRIDAVDISRLYVPKPDTDVPDGDIDEEVERLRREQAEFRVPDPMRGALEGDELLVDYAVRIDGKLRADMSAEGRKLELGGGVLLPELEQGLLGAVPGEDRTIDVPFPEDHGNAQLKGKTASFAVKVKELHERDLPEVDDEFAKDVGDFETLLELRLSIRKRFEEQAARRGEAETRQALIDKLVETNEVPVPPSMVEQEREHMMAELNQILQMSGGQSSIGEELQQGMGQRAERKVRAAILLGALARQEGISVQPGDLDQKLTELSAASGNNIAKVRADFAGERMEMLESQILEEKLTALLLGKAKIGQEEPAASKQAAAKKAASKQATPKKAPAKTTAARSAQDEKPTRRPPTRAKSAASKKAAKKTPAKKAPAKKATKQAKPTKSAAKKKPAKKKSAKKATTSATKKKSKR